VFRRLGRAEAGEGRSLEALQSALRAGARVALRWLTRASQWMEAPLETLGLLAEALFASLLAWLETGKSSSVASRLFIHPQTARYRLHQLQHLFGEQLDDPDVRFELTLVLRARQASPPPRPGPSPRP
jgi:hypothetical protein